ncbi:MAG: SMP-30/gluconolactonase/LRE family protein [Pirellulaceae bacterium]
MSVLTLRPTAANDTFSVELRSRSRSQLDNDASSVSLERETWNARETAVIVCDVWDAHHSPNAVQRMEQFLPRLSALLSEARQRGAIIIHSPSDCMDAYQDTAARQRAIRTPAASNPPHLVQSWCSMIPAEQQAVYPIDQSDGGADDRPEDAEKWAAHLSSLGRNPQLPWRRQHPRIEIDQENDYISDEGDVVWNILQARGIRNVIMTGVHTNMCVLGRPFGLRQLAHAGMNVVLVRDLTDTMYNPKRWPYVSHFEGTRRVIAHIERYVCPTIRSDQILGGEPFRFQGDVPETATIEQTSISTVDGQQRLSFVQLPHASAKGKAESKGTLCLRCVVRIPSDWTSDDLFVRCDLPDARFWCNSVALSRSSNGFKIPAKAVVADDFNLFVMKASADAIPAPVIVSRKETLELAGRWQASSDGDPETLQMPLPAKFGGSPEIVFVAADPLWTARPLTFRNVFTGGIEGPACDHKGNVFAVNYKRQGTIGRVTPQGQGEVFLKLPEGSIGNGIRFDRDGRFFVADYARHNILRVDPKSKAIDVFAHNETMNQPNDIALAPDGTLYASDPNWSQGTGQIWRIDRDGTSTRVAEKMGTTNGIEVSPDGKRLYVNESQQRNVWSFEITQQRTLVNKQLIRQFEDHGFDGMRCDVDGNLYITRYGKGTVVKMTPAGEILQEISVLGARPSNLCFGGPDGRTVYVTEVEHRRLVTFRVDRPGRSWSEQQP